MSPLAVADLGKGSNKIGAEKLKQMIEKIRAQKKHSVTKIPPKAKNLAAYA
jgi:hypothetical protein